MNLGPVSAELAKRALYPLLVMAGDVAVFYLALGLSYLMRVGILARWIPLTLSQTYGDFASLVWLPIVVLVVFAYEGLYTKSEPFWEETRTIVRALFLSYFGIFSIMSLGKLSTEISRSVIVGTGIFSLVLVPLVRIRWKPILHRMGFGVKRMLLIGDNPVGRLAHLGLFRDHYMGIRVVGFVNVPEKFQSQPLVDEILSEELMGEVYSADFPPALPYLGPLESLSEIVGREGLHGAIVALPHVRGKDLFPLIEEVQRFVLSLYVVPNVSQVSLLNSELLYLFYEKLFLLGVHNNIKSRLNRWLKESFDISIALLLCIPLLPVLGGIALLVMMTSPGPVIFTQRRVGRGGQDFNIYKFRTMHEGAEVILHGILEKDPNLNREFLEKHKLSNDPRVTWIGKFLRKTSLDELPQIFNVLRGEMSLVGPRPVTRSELKDRYREASVDYCLVRPGMTGLWQVSGRSEKGYGLRVRLDVWYIRNWSLWFDIVILVRTVGVVLGRKGAV